MATEFNIDLPAQYTYSEEQNPEENLKVLSEYIRQLHTSLEEMFQRVFLRAAGSVDAGVEDNIATINEDEGIKDSGVAISTDGTMAANSDTKVPTEKAVVTYTTATFLPLAGGTMTGDIDFAENEAKGILIEPRTSDPGTPANGRCWIRTDL